MGVSDLSDIVRHMGLTHGEFLRSLPAAVTGMDCRVEGSSILISAKGRRIRIQLGPERARCLGSLVLPQTEVSLHFDGFSAEQRKGFMKRFDLAFQRGGG